MIIVTFYDLVNLKVFDPNLIELEENESANDVFIYCVNYVEKHPFRLYIRELLKKNVKDGLINTLTLL